MSAFENEERQHRNPYLEVDRLMAETIALRAENERLKAENKLAFEERDAHRKWGDELRADNERLRAENERPNLGLATTRELLDELRARIEMHALGGLDYRTVDGEKFSPEVHTALGEQAKGYG